MCLLSHSYNLLPLAFVRRRPLAILNLYFYFKNTRPFVTIFVWGTCISRVRESKLRTLLLNHPKTSRPKIGGGGWGQILKHLLYSHTCTDVKNVYAWLYDVHDALPNLWNARPLGQGGQTLRRKFSTIGTQ